MRINKFLAQAGVASRRKVDQLIQEGKVTVNSLKAQLGQEVDLTKDKVLVDGKPITQKEEFEYIILNKSKGVTSTTREFPGQKTVIEQVKSKNRLYPVGRLDVDSEGLILLTNDGELTNKLIHPKHHIPKVYEVLFLGRVGNDKIGQMQRGVKLEDGLTKQAKVKQLRGTEHTTLLEITLFEGKKRQLRRMAAALHLHILGLKRTQIGPIILGNLGLNKYRPLSKKEILTLKHAVHLL